MSDTLAEAILSDAQLQQPLEKASVLDQLLRLAEELLAAEQAVYQAESSLKMAQDRLKTLKEIRIPEIMAQTPFSELKLRDGRTIRVVDQVQASSAQVRWDEIYAHLETINQLHLARWKVELDVPEIPQELLEKVAKAAGTTPTTKGTIHHATLKKWVKERNEAGLLTDRDKELFKVYISKTTEVTNNG